MPEILFRVRWPDGGVAECYSPSRAITEFLEPASYSLEDFVRRSRQGLTAASERVRARYGFPCSRAAAQLAAIEREAARHKAAEPVTVLSIEPL